MFKPVEECGVVKSNKSCRHIERSENSIFARGYIFQDVVCKFEQSSFGKVDFAVSRLKRSETGRNRYVGENACKSKSFQNSASCMKKTDLVLTIGYGKFILQAYLDVELSCLGIFCSVLRFHQRLQVGMDVTKSIIKFALWSGHPCHQRKNFWQ